MVEFIQTFSESFLQRHRDHHLSHPEFGTHQHPYLQDTIRHLAVGLTREANEPPSLLDYGCGKGIFMQAMARQKLFRYIRGFDPAVPAFSARPAQMYDLVTCLDVLDQLEEHFVEPVITDVAQFTGRLAVFSVITRQTPALAHLNPRSGPAWQSVIDRHMTVSRMTIRPSTAEEIAQGACPERAILVAEPRRGVSGA